MDHSASLDPEQLLTEARAGHTDSLGALLQRYRAYLQTVACANIDPHLRPRVNASDLVQETLFLASRHFHQFRGNNESEWLQWLRRIMRRRLFRFARQHVRARKRDVYREISLEWDPGTPVPARTGRLEIAAHGSSPSACAERRELADVVAQRLARLSPAHREVLVYRNLKGLSFEEVAQRMGRSTGSVRVLWLRALDQLRRQLTIEDWL